MPIKEGMKWQSLFLILAFLMSACALKPSAETARTPQAEVNSSSALFLENVKIGSLPFALRMGYLPEAKNSTFKGCVIYLEGLSDSIMNHQPLYQKLSEAGYRVLMFDYLGQGLMVLVLPSKILPSKLNLSGTDIQVLAAKVPNA